MNQTDQLKLMILNINTRNEHTVYMRDDCPVCISEGFEALTRIRIKHKNRSVIASINVLSDNRLLDSDEAGLSNKAIEQLEAGEGDVLSMSYLPPLLSMRHVRSKVYGQALTEQQLKQIIGDIAAGYYSNVEIASFVKACAGESLSLDEVIHLTHAMISAGNRIHWPDQQIFDKHCIGGLPGNRTSPIVVAIIAAFGLKIPKTSSRAITSPAGTADTLEAITNVKLSMERIKEVVEMESGCLAWGGSVSLSPADDILIKVERALDIDSEGQLIASVLSKKAAVSTTHVVIDIPAGPTVKVRTMDAANKLEERIMQIAQSTGLILKIVITDGSQPVGRGVGPALEAMDVLKVLRNEDDASVDLRARAINLSAALLELSGRVRPGKGKVISEELINSGTAYAKFRSICEAQRRFTEPEPGMYKKEITASGSGWDHAIDNRKIARLAKLAGAPDDPGAGVLLNKPLYSKVQKGEALCTIYSESPGETDYAMDYYREQKDLIRIEQTIPENTDT